MQQKNAVRGEERGSWLHRLHHFTKGRNLMKLDFKRITSVLLALVLVVSALGGLPLTASADETEETITKTNSYVLNYSDSDLSSLYGYTQPYMYTTPFMVDHTATLEDGSEYYSGANFPEVFNLINTTKLPEGGEGAYASIAAYCTDATTGIRKNTSYRRINLEDSTYYQSGAAGKIRAVVLNGYPYRSVETIQANANVWLQSQGLPEIAQLQSGEAILATQVAIWQLANAGHYTVEDYYCGWKDLTTSSWASYLSDVIDASAIHQQPTDNTEWNVEGLTKYLYALDAVSPRYDAVSESTLENPVYTAVKAEDGTYTVTASVYVNTTVGEGDQLTLGAACGDQVQTQAITAAGSYEFVFTGLSDRPAVTLEINGTQHGGDVYLFDAEGDRSASQTLVGYDDSVLPVHGEVTVTPDRILNIFKSTSEDDGKTPLANIQFNIYLVATMAQLERGDVVLSEQPTQADIEAYKTAENLVAILSTDAQGFATYNFTANGNPDGVYLIVEQFSAATTGPVEPFFLAVPGTTAEGDGYAYTLNVNPKNVTETGPDIKKDVTEIENDHDTFDVGQTHTWIIRGGIPAGIGTAQKYEISDTIDYRLTYEKGSPVVKLYTKAGSELELTKDVHYTLTEGTVTVDEKTVDSFRISLTPAGMAYVAANQGSGENTPEVRVYFKAVINQNAQMGTEIPNRAHVDYTNSAGIDYDADSDVPEVHTGGINILKTDTAGKVLSGAVFKIARLADESEENAEILNIGDQEQKVVFVEFYASADLSGEKVLEVTTDEEGKAAIYGLAYGDYYIVETKAPAGYNLLTQPIAVTVNAASHLTAADGRTNDAGEVVDNTVKVINTRFVLPETGGMGTTLFTVAGIAIIGMACILLLANRKKRV